MRVLRETKGDVMGEIDADQLPDESLDVCHGDNSRVDRFTYQTRPQVRPDLVPFHQEVSDRTWLGVVQLEGGAIQRASAR